MESTRRQNDKRWLTVYGWILVIVTIVLAVLFIGAVLVWACHQLLPEHLNWLSNEKLAEIKALLFSSSMGAVVLNIVRSQVSKAH